MVLWTLLIPCIYLPTLALPFDFNDDGILIYPIPGLRLSEQWQRVWERTLGDYHARGPFRPGIWAFWEMTANYLGPHQLAQRTARLAWAALATSVFMWLLIELRVRPGAAVLATALAMWNPYRNEIWMALGLTEALAMPFALLSLVCALRAARAARAWPWDLAGTLGMLAALSCKNTFAAVVPAQMLLRLCGGGLPWREALRSHGLRSGLLGLTLLLPILHFVHFKLHCHAEPYATHFTLAQIGRMTRSVLGAVSIDLIVPAVVFAAWTLGMQRATNLLPSPPSHDRLSLAAGLVLLICGIGIYLPIEGVAGRYTIPAVWGLDIGLAVLLSTVVALPPSKLRRASVALFGLGLVAVFVCNLGKQARLTARAELLWQALTYVEQQAPPHTQLAWMGVPLPTGRNPDLSLCEGQHFAWHLQGRRRTDLVVVLQNQLLPAASSAAAPEVMSVFVVPALAGFRKPAKAGTTNTDTTAPALALTAAEQPPTGDWQLRHDFHVPYWMGWRTYSCYLWSRPVIAAVSGLPRLEDNP